MVGRCKLCGENRELCNSHIIPEFCYKPLYDEKHRVTRVNLPEERHLFSSIQKGFREYLLCRDCEGLLNDRYEKPFEKYWDKVQLPTSPPVARIAGFDYASFKLFHLSILWRAGVCSSKGLKESLGPYGEKLRAMLLSNNPGPVAHYPILGRLMLRGESVYTASPIGLALLEGRHENCRKYIQCYCGVEWMVILTDHPTDKQMRLAECAPQADGSMLLVVGDWLDGRSMRDIINRMRRGADGGPGNGARS